MNNIARLYDSESDFVEYEKTFLRVFDEICDNPKNQKELYLQI